MTTWRIRQQKFFKGPIEFEQDFRIKNFFSKTLKEPTDYYGDISYFKEINFSKSYKKYNQVLLIFNELIEKSSLINIIENYKNNKLKRNSKICICINKFLIYTQTADVSVVDDYDQALYNIISNIFKDSEIKYFFEKNVKGDHFNYASPTTQFFIDYKK